ncbi:MAG: tRNA uridine-5-carboxymethylaminomethyl(34) synthesis GTPase MnmE [Pseudomonadota bacterium]
MSETIFARASGAGKAGVAVYRLSGPDARAIATRTSGRSLTPRTPTLVDLLHANTGERIDQALVILFAAPASFTGEDVAEFHCHGSAAVEAALYAALQYQGARPAESGEFTRRAFENGKLDLAQVEALADLIDAETSEQRKQALGQLDGRLSARADGWRQRLIAIAAPLEADVDFPDEGDVPAAVAARAQPQIDALIDELQSYRSASSAARAIRDGVQIAIIGAPNAGKSSLLNALAGSALAIVSATPGTTRDVLEARLDLDGVPAIVADTAGIRDQSSDDIEAEGMRRAKVRAAEADIRLLVIDPLTDGYDLSVAVSRETIDRISETDFVVWSKADLATSRLSSAPDDERQFRVSAKTGEGVSALIAALSDRAAQFAQKAGDAPLTRARHAVAVDRALEALDRARSSLGVAPELASEDVRVAARALASITGAVDVEDVLGAIFESFCIGK